MEKIIDKEIVNKKFGTSLNFEKFKNVKIVGHAIEKPKIMKRF